MTRDVGNDAFLSAADRFYNADNALRDEEGNPLCSHCECNPVRDASEAVYATYMRTGFKQEGDVCLECASRIFEEELEEFTEGLRSTFFPIITAYRHAAE